MAPFSSLPLFLFIRAAEPELFRRPLLPIACNLLFSCFHLNALLLPGARRRMQRCPVAAAASPAWLHHKLLLVLQLYLPLLHYFDNNPRPQRHRASPLCSGAAGGACTAQLIRPSCCCPCAVLTLFHTSLLRLPGVFFNPRHSAAVTSSCQPEPLAQDSFIRAAGDAATSG